MLRIVGKKVTFDKTRKIKTIREIIQYDPVRKTVIRDNRFIKSKST